MLSARFTFERFLATFVPGAIFVFGSFYLHRQFFQTYFPNVAGFARLAGSTAFTAFSPEAQLLLFSVVALCMGAIFHQMSDMAVISMVETDSKTVGMRHWARKITRQFARIFTLAPLPDYRRLILRRYLEGSPRREAFLSMLRDWAHVDEAQLAGHREPALVHQHLVNRLKVHSEQSYLLYKETLFPLLLAASIFTSLVALCVSAAAAPFSATAVRHVVKVHPLSFILLQMIFVYAAALLAGYNLRRRIRSFYSVVVTLALHTHDQEVLNGRRRRGDHVEPQPNQSLQADRLPSESVDSVDDTTNRSENRRAGKSRRPAADA